MNQSTKNNFETNLKHLKNLWCHQLHHWSFFFYLVLTLVARGWIWVPPIWALLLTTSWQCWRNKSFADALPDGFCFMNNSPIYILHVHKFISTYSYGPYGWISNVHLLHGRQNTSSPLLKAFHAGICFFTTEPETCSDEQFKAQLEEQFVLWDLFLVLTCL